MTNSENRPIFLLSIDGGGVLGLLALSVLKQLEKRMNRPISSLFDCISGVSAGGLMALGLVVPNGDQSGPAYSADDLYEAFKQGSREIFKKKIVGRIPIIGTINGLFSAQYSAKIAQKLYIKLLGQHTVSQSLIQTIIPAYNIHGTDAKNPRIKIFDSLRIRQKNTLDYFMHEIALATSAVPTYFPPQRIHGIQGGQAVLSDDYFIDGGVAINNPTLLAYERLRILYPLSPIHILSLGTGRKRNVYESLKKASSPGVLAWKDKIVPLISDPQLSVYEKLLKNSRKKELNPGTYWRIQPRSITHLSTLDDTSPGHLGRIHQISIEMLHDHRHILDAVVTRLWEKIRSC